jgi:hypothetical protein
MIATKSEAVREWAYTVGINRQDREWILSDYDTWELNPHYVGPPSGTHPECDDIPEFEVYLDFNDARMGARRAAAYLDIETRIEHYKGKCWVVWLK